MKRIFTKSLNLAADEQGLTELRNLLAKSVPDISHQYSSFKIDDPYLVTKVRNQHAFQISLIKKVIAQFNQPVIVDIGDSAGTHLQYIYDLFGNASGLKCLSVNMDMRAIKRIRDKGMEAVHARAEELDKYNINADIFLCYQTLEHIMDPCHFLYNLSQKTKAKLLIVTVPFLVKSRVGLNHIKNNQTESVSSETTHIFELCPEDWRLIVRHSGWEVVDDMIYYQYPRRNIYYLTKLLWKRNDFEGFYGMILERNSLWSSKYIDW